MSWNPILCAQDDLEQRLGDLTSFTQSSEDESAAIVDSAIAQFGVLATTELKSFLPELFVTTVGYYANVQFRDWLILKGYSYDDLDNVLDEVTNPEVLLPWAVAGSLQNLCEKMVAKFQVKSHETAVLMVDQREYWKKEMLRLKPICMKQIKVDLNGDGKIQDFGRVRTHNVWNRG